MTLPDSPHLETFNNYVGIPWLKGGSTKNGADCWGLTLLVLNKCFGVIVDKYLGSKASNRELAKIINSEINSDSWSEVLTPTPGNVCVMFDRKTKMPLHMGVVVTDEHIIHALDSKRAGVSQIHTITLLNRIFQKLEYYEHVK